MSYIFFGCSSLLSLPNISKWNTNNVTNMSHIFFGCSSLSSLPDISKWNTNNVINMMGIFDNSINLILSQDFLNLMKIKYLKINFRYRRFENYQ